MKLILTPREVGTILATVLFQIEQIEKLESRGTADTRQREFKTELQMLVASIRIQAIMGEEANV